VDYVRPSALHRSRRTAVQQHLHRLNRRQQAPHLLQHPLPLWQQQRHLHRSRRSKPQRDPGKRHRRVPFPCFTVDAKAMDIFLQQIINGLVQGSIYALVALGYTMVYGIMGLINFAHGEVVMIGTMVAITVTPHWRPWGCRWPLPVWAA
jgi:hypothetical protein